MRKYLFLLVLLVATVAMAQEATVQVELHECGLLVKNGSEVTLVAKPDLADMKTAEVIFTADGLVIEQEGTSPRLPGPDPTPATWADVGGKGEIVSISCPAGHQGYCAYQVRCCASAGVCGDPGPINYLKPGNSVLLGCPSGQLQVNPR